MKMSRSLVQTVCPYCGAGYGLRVLVNKSRAAGIEYMPDQPASGGDLCSKGNAALEILEHSERLRSPLWCIGDICTQISWDDALATVAGGMQREMRNHGPDLVGILSSSKCTNEEINSSDAVKLSISDKDIVDVKTPRGRTRARARIADRVRPGVVFLPFHFPGDEQPHKRLSRYRRQNSRVQGFSMQYNQERLDAGLR